MGGKAFRIFKEAVKQEQNVKTASMPVYLAAPALMSSLYEGKFSCLISHIYGYICMLWQLSISSQWYLVVMTVCGEDRRLLLSCGGVSGKCVCVCLVSWWKIIVKKKKEEKNIPFSSPSICFPHLYGTGQEESRPSHAALPAFCLRLSPCKGHYTPLACLHPLPFPCKLPTHTLPT